MKILQKVYSLIQGHKHSGDPTRSTYETSLCVLQNAPITKKQADPTVEGTSLRCVLCNIVKHTAIRQYSSTGRWLQKALEQHTRLETERAGHLDTSGQLSADRPSLISRPAISIQTAASLREEHPLVSLNNMQIYRTSKSSRSTSHRNVFTLTLSVFLFY
jgi:hypothetical protein